MLLRSGDEEVALWAVVSGLPETVVELRVELDGVHRHLDVRCGGELRPHSAHALTGGSLALVRLAFDDEYVAASLFGEMPGDAGADDASAYNDDVCGFHDEGHCNRRGLVRDVMAGSSGRRVSPT